MNIPSEGMFGPYRVRKTVESRNDFPPFYSDSRQKILIFLRLCARFGKLADYTLGKQPIFVTDVSGDV
jgi:hypothetical protein